MKKRIPKVAVLDIKYLMPKYQSVMLLKDIKIDFSKLNKLRKDKVTEINIVACHSDSVSVNRINNYVTETFNNIPNQYNFVIKITFVLVRGRKVIRAMAAELVRQQLDKLKESGVDTITYTLPPFTRKHKCVKNKHRKSTVDKVVSLGIIPSI